MKLLADWILRAFVLLVTSYVVPGFKVDSLITALVVALVLGLLNVFLRPVLILFTLPANILTLGLFTFVVNALLLMLASVLVKGFRVDSFFAAVLASVVISVVSGLLNTIIK